MILWDVKVRYEKSEKVTSLKVKKKKKKLNARTEIYQKVNF